MSKSTRIKLLNVISAYEKRIEVLNITADNLALDELKHDHLHEVEEDIDFYKRVQNDLLTALMNEDVMERDQMKAELAQSRKIEKAKGK